MDKPEVSITEPVIGLRHWNVTPEGELHSPIIEGVWQPGVNVAKCIKGRVWQPWNHDGPSPVGGCSCGIYAHHEQVGISHSSGIIGVVRGWGSVRVHPDGWRAEKARIVALVDEQKLPYFECDPFSSTSVSTESQSVIIFKTLEGRPRLLMQAASLRYDVPIITARQAANSLDEFGTSVPDNLKPGGQHR